MQQVPIDPRYFEGAISLEHGDGWLKPWRLPFDDLALFPTPGDSLVQRAENSSGVRLRFETSATELGLDFLPLGAVGAGQDAHNLDVTIEGEILATAAAAPGAESATFSALPAGSKIVELWLPQDCGIALRGMSINDGAECWAVEDQRPKWVTYGSSLTHCVRANSTSRIWPGIVARACKLNLTSLGYGGNCCLEPMVGKMIRDLPADFISLKLGINCIGGALAPRTFPGAVMGLVQIIREKQPDTPIALVSPIGYPPHETTPNVLGNTIEQMRVDIQDVHKRLTERGDRNLYYFTGLDIFNLDEIAAYTQDQCHPNGDGIELMGKHFLETVMTAVPIAGRIRFVG